MSSFYPFNPRSVSNPTSATIQSLHLRGTPLTGPIWRLSGCIAAYLWGRPVDELPTVPIAELSALVGSEGVTFIMKYLTKNLLRSIYWAKVSALIGSLALDDVAKAAAEAVRDLDIDLLIDELPLSDYNARWELVGGLAVETMGNRKFDTLTAQMRDIFVELSTDLDFLIFGTPVWHVRSIPISVDPNSSQWTSTKVPDATKETPSLTSSLSSIITPES